MFKTVSPRMKSMVKAVNIQVVSMSEKSNFVIASIFKCNNEECEREKVFNHFIHGATQPCFFCMEHRDSTPNNMSEKINERVCTNRKVVHLKSFTAGPSKFNSSFFNFITLIFLASTTFRAFFYQLIDPKMYGLAKLGARIKSIEGNAVCWEICSGVREVGIDVLNCEFENPFQMIRDPYGPRDYPEEIKRLQSRKFVD